MHRPALPLPRMAKRNGSLRLSWTDSDRHGDLTRTWTLRVGQADSEAARLGRSGTPAGANDSDTELLRLKLEPCQCH